MFPYYHEHTHTHTYCSLSWLNPTQFVTPQLKVVADKSTISCLSDFSDKLQWDLLFNLKVTVIKTQKKSASTFLIVQYRAKEKFSRFKTAPQMFAAKNRC